MRRLLALTFVLMILVAPLASAGPDSPKRGPPPRPQPPGQGPSDPEPKRPPKTFVLEAPFGASAGRGGSGDPSDDPVYGLMGACRLEGHAQRDGSFGLWNEYGPYLVDADSYHFNHHHASFGSDFSLDHAAANITWTIRFRIDRLDIHSTLPADSTATSYGLSWLRVWNDSSAPCFTDVANVHAPTPSANEVTPWPPGEHQVTCLQGPRSPGLQPVIVSLHAYTMLDDTLAQRGHAVAHAFEGQLLRIEALVQY